MHDRELIRLLLRRPAALGAASRMPCALAGAHPRPSGMKVRVGRGMSGRACGRPHSMQSLWTAVETALVGYVREPLCASSCPRAACAQRPSSCSSPHHLARPSSRCRLGFRDLSWPAPRCARRACLRWSASTSDARPCSSWWLARIHLLAVLSIRVATWLRYGQRRGFAWRVMYIAVYPTPRDTRANIDDEWHLTAVVLVQHLLHLRGGQMVKVKALRAVKRHAILVAGGKEAMFGFFRRKVQAYKSASSTSSSIHGFATIDPARSRRCCRAESQARKRRLC